MPRYEYASEWFRERHTKEHFYTWSNLLVAAKILARNIPRKYPRQNIFNLESLNHGGTDSEVEIFV